MHDGAENWFLQTSGVSGSLRARLVMELTVARAAFGGQMGDPAWSDLPLVSPLPDNVARDAVEVRAAIGVSRAQRPREAIARLVQYFRGFAEADESPRGRSSVYLDIALSKKGVCRHRAFAFLVTAQSLGIPTRLVENEAHAWVEVHDGVRWRRIDPRRGGPHVHAGLGGVCPSVRSTSPRPTPSPGPRTPSPGMSWCPTRERGRRRFFPARRDRAPRTGGARDPRDPAPRRRLRRSRPLPGAPPPRRAATTTSVLPR